MEFVIVAPLYLFLLGGVFFVGDLVLNRIRVHWGDHLVTWVAASRFCPVDENGDKDGDKIDEILKPIYKRSIGGPIADFKVDYDEDNDDDTKINSFMALYMGGVVKLPVKMPAWVEGMMSAGESMANGSSEWSGMDEVTYESEGIFRSFSFHRLSLSGLDGPDDPGDAMSRSRSVSGGDLVAGGVLNAVLSDTWASKELADDQKIKISAPGREATDFQRGRILGYFGE